MSHAAKLQDSSPSSGVGGNKFAETERYWAFLDIKIRTIIVPLDTAIMVSQNNANLNGLTLYNSTGTVKICMWVPNVPL
jgi:hypothetical protein